MMFVVDEATAESIRRVYNESGELSAVAELRRNFPGITDNENARQLRADDLELEAATTITQEA